MDMEYLDTSPIPQRAWQDTRKWLRNSFLGWVIAILGCGVLSGIFAPMPPIDTIVCRALFGLLGAVVALILIILVTYIVHLWITPIRQRKEAYKCLGDLIASSPAIHVEPRVYYRKRAVLEITNRGADANFTAKAKVVEGIVQPETFNMCWQAVPNDTQCHIDNGGMEPILVAEISPNTVETNNILTTVLKGGIALYKMGEQRIGVSTSETVEKRKLNKRYPTMVTTLEDKCVIEVTLTATASLLKPFARRYSVEIDSKDNLCFTQLPEPKIDKEHSQA